MPPVKLVSCCWLDHRYTAGWTACVYHRLDHPLVRPLARYRSNRRDPVSCQLSIGDLLWYSSKYRWSHEIHAIFVWIKVKFTLFYLVFLNRTPHLCLLTHGLQNLIATARVSGSTHPPCCVPHQPRTSGKQPMCLIHLNLRVLYHNINIYT